MATQKKGCGCLISSLVLFLIAIGIAVVAGVSAYSSGKELVDEAQHSTEFTTPNGTEFSSTEDSEITIWLTGAEKGATGKIDINLIDLETGEKHAAIPPEGTVNINELSLIGTFHPQPNKTYKITTSGLADGNTVKVINISGTAIMAIASKGLWVFLGGGIFGLLSLVCGIIGLVKYFSSNNTPATSP